MGASVRLLHGLVLTPHGFQINPLLFGPFDGGSIGVQLRLKAPERLEHGLLLFGELANEADLVFAQTLLLLRAILVCLVQLVFEEGPRADRLLAPRLKVLVAKQRSQLIRDLLSNPCAA